MVIALLLAVVVQQPNLAMTPGTIDPAATVAKLCVPGYTDTIRRVTPKMKREVYNSYGLIPDGSKYEVDHYISLAIGGNNDVKNLWPQPWPEARHKDVVETWLHRQMCKGKMTLVEAQKLIRVWPDVYARIKKK